MKRVYLRVTNSGDILVKRGGDNDCDFVIKPHQKDGMPSPVFGKGKKVTVLPFYSMTDREEAELLLGRAATEVALAYERVIAQREVVAREVEKEKALEGQIEVGLSSTVRIPEGSVQAWFRLKSRVEAEAQLNLLLKEHDDRVHEANIQREKTFRAALAERSKHGATGMIPSDFGKSCK